MFDVQNDVQTLAVAGNFRSCSPSALCRSIAANIGIPSDDVFAIPDLLVIVAPFGAFTEPADYRAWVDEGISEAERHTAATDRAR